MNEPVQITYTLAPSDILWNMFHRMMHRREGLLTVFLTLFVGSPLFHGPLMLLLKPEAATKGALYVSALILTVFGVIVSRALSRYRSQDKRLHTVQLTVSSTGVEMKTDLDSTHMRWEMFRTWHEASRHLRLVPEAPRSPIVVPLRGLDDEKLWLLRGYLKRHKLRSTRLMNRSTGSRTVTIIACGLSAMLCLGWSWFYLTYSPVPAETVASSNAEPVPAFEAPKDEPKEPTSVEDITTPDNLPMPPLRVEPTAPPSEHQGKNLKAMGPELIAALGDAHYEKGDMWSAFVFAYWAVKGGASSIYNLACYATLAGQHNDGFYWLQQAALKEGVDPEWAREDPDLEELYQDARWPVVDRFLLETSAYWMANGTHINQLVVPKRYKPSRPIPVVVWLHGAGGKPNMKMYQTFADNLGVAFVGVSGTRPLGPKAFVWSEVIEQDEARINDAFKEFEDKFTPKPGKIVLFGFSQGAAMATEIAAGNPERYAGAICLSPGTDRGGSLPVAFESIDRQRYVIGAGAQENPITVARARFYDKGLRKMGAQVRLKLYPEMDQHAFPRDFIDVFPDWVAYTLHLKR